MPKTPKVPKASDVGKKAASGAEDNDRKQLSEVNRLAQDGSRRVLSDLFGDYASNLARMDAVRVTYDDCSARIKTVQDTSLNEGAMRRWNEFKRDFEQAELQLPASKALDPINKLHTQRIPVQGADLDAFDAAVAIFEKGHDEESANALKKWKKTVAEVRSTNVNLLKSAVAKAASDAAHLDLSQRNDTLARADAALKTMEETANADTGPIDAAVWASFDAALTEADAYSPKIRTSFTHAAWKFRVYVAWFTSERAQAVAKAFGSGDVHASGLLTKKEARIAFEAEVGSCYALIGRFMERTGNEEVGDLDRVWDKNFADVVPFQGGERNFVRFQGACPTKDIRLSFDIKLKAAGSKVSYQWLVISWKREAFPIEVAARSEVWGPEPCSASMTENSFKHAVPGMLIWSAKGAPYLANGVNQGSYLARNLHRQESVVGVSGATGAWPAKKDLEDIAFYETCHIYQDSMDPLVNTMIKCHQALNKQYHPKYAAANKRLAGARTIGARNAAQAELGRLSDAEGKARESKCGPLEVKVEKSMSAMIERMNDWFLANNTPKDNLDVFSYLRDVAEGRRRFSN